MHWTGSKGTKADIMDRVPEQDINQVNRFLCSHIVYTFVSSWQ